MRRSIAFLLLLSLTVMIVCCTGTAPKESEELSSPDELTVNPETTSKEEKEDVSSDLPTESITGTEIEALASFLPDTDRPIIAENENDRILWEVFNSERQFIFSSGFSSDEEMNLKEYMEKTISGNQDGYIDIERYIFIDLDSDGHNELIVMIYHFTEEYLIFHVSGNDVYGYPEVQKGIEVLKTDGSIQSGGMSYFDCFTVSFENNVRTNTFFIRASEKPELYEVDGQPRSFDEVKEAYDKWKEIEDAEWVVLFFPDYSKYPNG